MVSTVVLSSFTMVAHAAPVTGFSSGYILSDNIMTNSQAMNVSQIQSFLGSKVTNCDTNGTQPASDFGRPDLTHAQYAALRGWAAPPYTCLKDYSENGIGSAQIIYNAAQTYQVNPEVLIVLLQKEQGLVTDTWPLPSEYRSATGYGCPDTSACDSQYYGLTNQVQWAAKMYHAIMTASPTWYSPYTVGNNYVAWNPNSACGGTTVNILNQATAALYDYTPYQPNAAALAAGYGTGDSCSSYGNRNFFEYFSDWFGSPLYGNFVRTTDNTTVYLIAGANKYPISDINILGALYPLGGVSYVSQSYLDSLTTGPIMGRVIRSSNGTIYFYDAGIKLSFGSCSQVADFGSTCGGAILLDDGEVNLLSTGPAMTNLIVTTSGKRFYVTSNTKKEVYDDQSLAQAGISNGINILSDASLVSIPYGSPIIRDGVFTRDRVGGLLYAYSGTSLAPVEPSLQSTYLGNVATNSLDQQGLALLTQGAQVGGYIKSSSGTSYIITSKGKMAVTTPSDWSGSFVTLSDATLSQIPTITSTGSAYYTVSFSNGGTIYLVAAGTLRPIMSWGGLVALTPSPSIITLPTYYLSNLAQGTPFLTPGTLVMSPNSPSVYLVDGLNSLIPMANFGPVTELGFGPIVITSDSVINSYNKAASVLSEAVQCGSNQGLAIGGSVYPVTLTSATYTTLSTTDCSLLTWKSTAPGFLLASNGTIFQIQNGQKNPIASYGKYLALGGNATNTIKASNNALDYFTNGTLIQ